MIARYRTALMVSTLVFFLPLTAHTEIKAGSTEIGVFRGYNWFEDYQNLKDQPVLGARLGYNFTKHWGVEGVVEYIDSQVDDRGKTGLHAGQFGSPMKSVDLTFYHADAIYHFLPDSKFTPFAAVGYGGAHYNPKISTGEMTALNAGVGAKYQSTDNIFLRADLRDFMVTEFFQETYHNVGLTVGITFAFGGPAKPVLTQVVKDEAVRPEPEEKKYVAPQPEPKPEEPVVILVSEAKVEEKVVAVVAEPMLEEKVVVLVLEDIHFDFDKSTLTQDARDKLKRNIRILIENPKIEVRIAGYTSASGTDAYNQKLSEQRAKAVEAYLVNEGVITAGRLTTIGYGEKSPAVHETAPKDLYSTAAKANMRVLFEVVVK
ncbi:MAG: OmpA family protein [Proteobacteria bacterium]|nr:OmpA family protein [Pseudomonadota bacterium]MBU1685806.1 OmpA family protein [Pseudomonadota bacterium]